MSIRRGATTVPIQFFTSEIHKILGDTGNRPVDNIFESIQNAFNDQTFDGANRDIRDPLKTHLNAKIAEVFKTTDRSLEKPKAFAQNLVGAIRDNTVEDRFNTYVSLPEQRMSMYDSLILTNLINKDSIVQNSFEERRIVIKQGAQIVLNTFRLSRMGPGTTDFVYTDPLNVDNKIGLFRVKLIAHLYNNPQMLAALKALIKRTESYMPIDVANFNDGAGNHDNVRMVLYYHVYVIYQNRQTTYFVKFVDTLDKEYESIQTMFVTSSTGDRVPVASFKMMVASAIEWDAIASDKSTLDIQLNEKLLSTPEMHVSLDMSQLANIYAMAIPQCTTPFMFSGHNMPTLLQVVCEIGHIVHSACVSTISSSGSYGGINADKLKYAWHTIPFTKCDMIGINGCQLALPFEIRRLFARETKQTSTKDAEVIRRILFYFMLVASRLSTKSVPTIKPLVLGIPVSIQNEAMRVIFGSPDAQITANEFFPTLGTDAWYVFSISIGYVLNRFAKQLTWDQDVINRPDIHPIIVSQMENILGPRDIPPNFTGFRLLVEVFDAAIFSRVGAYIANYKSGGSLVNTFRQIRVAIFRMSFFSNSNVTQEEDFVYRQFLESASLPSYGLAELKKKYIASANFITNTKASMFDSLLTGAPTRRHGSTANDQFGRIFDRDASSIYDTQFYKRNGPGDSYNMMINGPFSDHKIFEILNDQANLDPNLFSAGGPFPNPNSKRVIFEGAKAAINALFKNNINDWIALFNNKIDENIIALLTARAKYALSNNFSDKSASTDVLFGCFILSTILDNNYEYAIANEPYPLMTIYTAIKTKHNSNTFADLMAALKEDALGGALNELGV